VAWHEPDRNQVDHAADQPTDKQRREQVVEDAVTSDHDPRMSIVVLADAWVAAETSPGKPRPATVPPIATPTPSRLNPSIRR
jgi:hypothetical protein